MTLDFSYDAYRSLLDLLARPRECLTFGELADGVPDREVLLLRHDVDMSPDAALRMAEIEADAGVRATYFLLLSSPWYNLLGEPSVPRRLRDLGHEVGLHYDAAVLTSGGGDPLDRLEEQARLLAALSGEGVRSIAMHNPSVSGDDPFRASRFVNAYDPRFTRDIDYHSDSCGAWRDGFVERLRQRGFPPAVQLLVHPVFWAETPRDRWKTLDDFLARDSEHRRALAEKIRALWSGHDGVREHDEREGD